MRIPLFLIAASLMVHAEPLSNANRESLLESFEKFRQTADSVEDARFRVALAAYRLAMTSDAEAMKLYLDCLEKVQYKDQQKDSSEFREWKRKESEKLASSDLRLALRYQLRWLILTLQAASEHSDKSRLAAEAQDCVDSLFSDYEKFAGHENILSQSATSSVFAQAYEIDISNAEKWPSSPLDLGKIYKDVLLPPRRSPERVQELRAVWIKYITQEGLKLKFTPPKQREPRKGRGGNDDKDDSHEPGKSPEYIKFVNETQPKLEWEMEEDLFKQGDQNGAAVRMLAHLQKYISHPSNREWSETYKSLLTAPAPEASASTP